MLRLYLFSGVRQRFIQAIFPVEAPTLLNQAPCQLSADLGSGRNLNRHPTANYTRDHSSGERQEATGTLLTWGKPSRAWPHVGSGSAGAGVPNSPSTCRLSRVPGPAPETKKSLKLQLQSIHQVNCHQQNTHLASTSLSCPGSM